MPLLGVPHFNGRNRNFSSLFICRLKDYLISLQRFFLTRYFGDLHDIAESYLRILFLNSFSRSFWKFLGTDFFLPVVDRTVRFDICFELSTTLLEFN